MRVVLSTCVVIWHRYQVAYGNEEAIRFWKEAWRGLFLPIILPILFALSGFLVAGSLYRSPSLRAFLALRIIRIFPALIVEIGLAAIVLGPIFTVLPLSDYVHSPLFHAYFLNMVGDVQFVLPGVFENNPERSIVNSQLWTVPFELECYLTISVLALIGMFRSIRLVVPIFVASTIGLICWNSYYGIVPNPAGGVSGRLLVLCFLAGVVVYAFRNKIPLQWGLASACFVGSMICVRYRYASYASPIMFAYLTAYLGLLNPRRSFIVKSGDYSYGLYLYSCPIQQAVAVLLAGHLAFTTNLLASFPIIVIFALFSWWCVEKPFLNLKKFVVGAPTAPLARSLNS